MRRRTAISVLAALGWGSARAGDAPQADPALQAAIAGPQRTPAYVARDGWRHPYETLRFFGIRPTATVVEINPGSGWYTEILAPYLREQGLLILAGPDARSPVDYRRRGAERLQQKLQAQPQLYDRVRLTAFEPPQQLHMAPPGSADLVLTFRNVHNWAADGDEAAKAVFHSAYEALKPGGVFGVVDHRLPANREQDAKVNSGYLHTAYVERLAQSVGFSLDAASEVNANPKDNAEHDGGVWALPPTLRHKDKDRERYLAIGESDRMTLKFVKR